MATAKKISAKKVATKAPAKKAFAKAVKRASEPSKQVEPTYSMSPEVKEWIERANSMIQHLRGKVDRLERENKELKSYRKFAESRILNVSQE